MTNFDLKKSIVTRVRRDPAFGRALFTEAASLFLNGEPQTARLLLGYLVAATVGFEPLATETGKPARSLHRMLSTKGNPTMDNLAVIFEVVRRSLDVAIQIRVVDAVAALPADLETERRRQAAG